jgi:hypothetical protein
VSTGPSGVPDALAADSCAGALVASGGRRTQRPRIVAAVSKSTFIFVLQ